VIQHPSAILNPPRTTREKGEKNKNRGKRSGDPLKRKKEGGVGGEAKNEQTPRPKLSGNNRSSVKIKGGKVVNSHTVMKATRRDLNNTPREKENLSSEK